ncbi:MAG TPA: DUF1868 domain-containing protein [Bacillota bacterium]|nr:DUF1868 domain-containing protein [Bacillota bacterium]
MEYTETVGTKFDEKGNPLKYLGTTLICFANDENSDLYKELVWAQTELKKASFAHKYAALPPSSFHMTVMGLSRDIDRDTKFWPEMFKPDTAWKDIDPIQKRIVDSIKKPRGFKMKIMECMDQRFRLAPYDQETEWLLTDYRAALSEKTGVRLDDHDRYVFHISLFYKLQKLNRDEEQELMEILNRINCRVHDKIESFSTGEPKFTIFENMYAFYEDISRRKDMTD